MDQGSPGWRGDATKAARPQCKSGSRRHFSLPSPEGVMPSSLDVLVVDDEPKICQLLEQLLIARGCTVRMAHDGLEGLQLFRERPSDVVITDIRMPRLTGVELLRELKHLDPLLDVVVITAYPSVEGAVEAVKDG